MQIVAHPSLERDLIDIATHIFTVTQDGSAARRRIIEARGLLRDVTKNPLFGAPLAEDLQGWRVRPGGRGRMWSVVYRLDADADRLDLALVAFAGQDWHSKAVERGRDLSLE